MSIEHDDLLRRYAPRLAAMRERTEAAAKYKDPNGGLNAEGRKHFGVKKGVVNYSDASDADKRRWVRWALRFTKTPRALKKPNGEPTRYALMFRAWGEPLPTSADAVRKVHDKALSRAKTLKMGQYAEKSEVDSTSDSEVDHEGGLYELALWEAIVEAEIADTPGAGHTGVMVALYPREHAAQALAVEGGEVASELHVTLAFLGDAREVGPERETELVDAVQEWASAQGPLSGEVSGLGVFTAGPDPVTYASIDLPGVAAARQELVELLTTRGFDVARSHGFTPHVTLAYADRRDIDVPDMPLHFEGAVVAFADRRTGVLFGTSPRSEQAIEAADGDDEERQIARKFTAEQRRKLADSGKAMSDGSFPIVNTEDLRNAVRLAHTSAQRRHVMRRARALGATGLIPDTWKRDGAAELPATTATSAAQWITPRPQPTDEPASDAGDTVKAFVTTGPRRTVITGPADFMPTWEKALTPNPHFAWMQGRFVGAETPNRNNAFWSSGDLELGHATVAHGPLNWLHEARHIIGTVAESRYLNHNANRGAELSAETLDPHIVAASAIWKWIYPDEAWVIEQASDAGKLWYSMECVSKEVECVGASGCGMRVSYENYIHGRACAHLGERSSIRRFVDPIFLGGAVIVPPTRPGWADSDARLMKQAASMAERAFDDAGHPDIPASDWEQMMASVLKYTEV